MRKVLSALVVCLGIAVAVSPALAFEQGTLRVAGGASFATATASLDAPTDADITTTDIVLSGGYFISPSMEIGFSYLSSSQDFDGEEITSTSMAPSFSYYFPAGENFIRVSLGYNVGTLDDGTDEIDISGFLLGGFYVYLIDEGVSIDFGVTYEDSEYEAFGETVDATGTAFGAGLSLYF